VQIREYVAALSFSFAHHRVLKSGITMNLFNRIFTIISLVILAILGAATLVVPGQMLQFANDLANGIHVDVFGGMTSTARITIRIALALVFVLVIFLLLWLETRRSGARHVEVAKASGGRIRIHTGDVETRIQQQVDAVSGILSSRVRVNERDRAVVAMLEVVAAPGIDLVAKGEEVAAVTRIAVQDQLGLKLFGKPQITMKSSKAKPLPATPVAAPPAARTDHTTGTKA
jgi:hypothetical protein